MGNVNAGTLKYAYSLLSEAQPPPPDLQLAAYSPGKNGVLVVVYKNATGTLQQLKRFGAPRPIVHRVDTVATQH